jgi:hypothetical protein
MCKGVFLVVNYRDPADFKTFTSKAEVEKHLNSYFNADSVEDDVVVLHVQDTKTVEIEIFNYITIAFEEDPNLLKTRKPHLTEQLIFNSMSKFEWYTLKDLTTTTGYGAVSIRRKLKMMELEHKVFSKISENTRTLLFKIVSK